MTTGPAPARVIAVAIGAFAWAALSAPAAHAQISGQNAEEAFLSLQHASGHQVVITALYRADSVYLPLGKLFTELGLDHTYDTTNGVVSGFFIRESDRYEIDLERFVARRNNTQIQVSARDLIIMPHEVYVLPLVLSRVFELMADVDMRELELRITASEPLPAQQRIAREQRRVRAGLPETLQPDAPIRFPRDRQMISGGALQYTLNAMSAPHGSLVATDVAAAAEVLGGDLQVNYSTGFGEVSSERPLAARWRYVFGDDSRLIRQVQIGNLTTRTLHNYELTGVRVTNEPVNPRTRLGSYLIVGETKPNWEVELQLNGQLVAFVSADEYGRFRFEIPLSYGGSLFSLKYFGPNGEVIVDERRIDVPPAFVPGGTLEYDLTAGRVRRPDWSILHARAHYGLTDWLTTGVGLEHVDLAGRRPAHYYTAAVRLPESFTIGMEAAPGLLYRGTVQGAFPSLAYVFGSISRAEQDPVYNPTGARERLSARAFAPFRVLDRPMGLTVSADRTNHWIGGQTDGAHVDLLVNLPRFKPSIGYTRARFTDEERDFLQTNRLELGLFFAPAYARRGPRLIGDVLLDVAADYDMSEGAWQLLRAELSRSVSRRGRATIAFERHPRLDENRFELRYQLDLSTVRATTAARTGGTGGFSVSQSVRGAVVVDPRYGYVGASARDQVGRAGATFRMFFDNNGDGLFTAGEPVIPGAAVRFRQSASVVPTSAGLLRAEDLLPYYRYTVRIDPTELPNPLWLPEFDTFSFVSDPNSFKPIDIPFYAGAIVEGRVVDAGEPRLHHLAGMRVHVLRLDGTDARTLECFSDGAFYAMGIPPGEYELRLDEDQLRRIGRVAQPLSQRVTVRALPDGDAVDGIEFRLYPAAAKGGRTP